jgi:hypothetical protein
MENDLNALKRRRQTFQMVNIPIKPFDFGLNQLTLCHRLTTQSAH